MDAAFLLGRLRAAAALRKRLALPSPNTTAYRLVNSEGDDLPGLVVDVFGDAAIVQITTLGMAQRRAELFDAIEAVVGPRSLYEVAAASYADLEGFSAQSRVVRGDPRPRVPCLEDGLAKDAPTANTTASTDQLK